MKKCLVWGLALSFCAHVWAAADLPVKLEKIHVDVHNRKALIRGAVFFKQNCSSCHALKYLRYDALTKEAGLNYEHMPKHDPSSWSGHPPPDLSLIARVRGAAWLYTYLQSFYEDAERPGGSNNLLMHNTTMPNPFIGMQGPQVLQVSLASVNQHPGEKHWYEVLHSRHAGMIPPGEFNNHLIDLVQYLEYAGDPSRVEREHLGYWVVLFLQILFILALALKHVYWHDIEGPDGKKRRFHE
jgi:ubiquinol-cytochrome c reductase cytochrome c1 subunit